MARKANGERKSTESKRTGEGREGGRRGRGRRISHVPRVRRAQVARTVEPAYRKVPVQRREGGREGGGGWVSRGLVDID